MPHDMTDEHASTLLNRPLTERRINHSAYLFWKLQCHLAKMLLKHTGHQARLRRQKPT
ncbi:hypothetical protein [Hydrogenovibrio halophilus]|uniref:hypothetical protein n=1 Tax=Hydrogenovibrio halophilus TaxID=373391 RepID=UPI00039F6A89|nr:hypothetical protein [Hydrogenovibrio halophilus]